MSYKKIISLSSAIFVFVMSILMTGCATDPNTGSNSNSNRTATIDANNANAASAPSASTVLEAREPERYTVTTTMTIQSTGETPQANIPQLQFSFGKLGDNRRLAFNLPSPAGEVIYIEKGNAKYLIYPARNQYVELDPRELGFELGNMLSPVSVVERLKERTQYEVMGTETINGRAATRYRFKGAADTRTRAGTVEADSILFVDQQTGLPLRSEVDAMLSSGKGARVITETSSIVMEPDPSLFEIPTGMNRVTTAELKQQVQSFVNALRVFAEYMRQQVSVPATPGN